MQFLRKGLPFQAATLFFVFSSSGAMFGQQDIAGLPDEPALLQSMGQATPPQSQPDTQSQTQPSTPQSQPPQPQSQPAPPQSKTTPQAQPHQSQSEQQLKQQEHQRILGIVPNFNTAYSQDVAPLTASQKFRLAFRSTIDPFTFFTAAADAGYSQAEDDFPGYGQGAQGYGKRLGASYADSFDGTMWGNAIFPALLHEDPRYFRKGTGRFMSRLWYATSTTVWTRYDSGKWGPNYANVAGNIVAGGISNIYYPSTDRGVGLTFQRAFTVTAEGALGAIGVEFWPDISRKFLHGRGAGIAATETTPATPNTPAAPH